MRRFRLLCVLGAWVVAGCGSTAQPEGLVLGTIQGFDPDDPHITVSAQALTVTVTVLTYGNGCYSAARTDAGIQGSTIEVTPFDRVAKAGACTDILKRFDHSSSVLVPAPGAYQVIVHGRQSPEGKLVDITRSVQVTG